MGIIKPAYMDYGEIWGDALKGLNLARGIKQTLEAGEIDRYRRKPELTPEEWGQYRALDPSGAMARQQASLMDDAQYRKGRARVAQELSTATKADKIRILNDFKKRQASRGQDTSGTDKMLTLFSSDNPADLAEGNRYVMDGLQMGVDEGYIKLPKEPEKTSEIREAEYAYGAGSPEAKEHLKTRLTQKNLTNVERELLAAGIRPNSPRGRALIVKKYAQEGQEVRVDPDGTVTLVSGRGVGQGSVGDLTKGVQTTLQKEVVSLEKSLGDLNAIESQYKPEYLQWLGKGKSFWTGVKSKAGASLTAEERDFVQGRKRFIQNVNQVFNAYRKEITGAAASARELEDLKKATINEDLSPVEFEAAFSEYKNQVARHKRLVNRLIREGVGGSLQKKGSPSAKLLDRWWLGNEDDDPVQRTQELMDMGYDREEIKKSLLSEGYI